MERCVLVASLLLLSSGLSTSVSGELAHQGERASAAASNQLSSVKCMCMLQVFVLLFVDPLDALNIWVAQAEQRHQSTGG